MLSVPKAIELVQNSATTVDRHLTEQLHALVPIRHRAEIPEDMDDATGSMRRLRGLARLGFGCE